MKIQAICWALLAIYLALDAVSCSLPNTKNGEGTSSKRSGSLSADKLKPTEAPLMTSSPRPTVAPRITPTTPRPVIVNSPPKTAADHKEAGHQTTANTAQPMAGKLKTDSAMQGEVMPKPITKVSQISKPAQVTGFITRNGNIYEIEGKDGIGLIEGRQSTQEEEMNICNYGSVVIYSDVPCEEVTNISVDGVQSPGSKDEVAQKQQTTAQPSNTNQTPNAPVAADSVDSEKPSNEASQSEDQRPPPRRRNRNKKRRVSANKRRRNNRRRISTSDEDMGGNSSRRQMQNQRNRRRRNRNGQRGNPAIRNPNKNRRRGQKHRRRYMQPQRNRRRNQQQQQNRRRRWQQQNSGYRRRVRNGNRRTRNKNGQRRRGTQSNRNRRFEYTVDSNELDYVM